MENLYSLQKIANELDELGFYKDADMVDELIVQAKKNIPTNKKLWNKALNEAKKKFKVYPSAYSNLWAAKKYKEWGGKWKKEAKYKPKGELGKWLKEEWVDISRKDKSGKHPPCGRSDSSKGAYPKCRPKNKAKQMSKKEKSNAVKQKRNEPNPKSGKGNKPTRDNHKKKD